MKPLSPFFKILLAAGCVWLAGILAALAEVPPLVITSAPTGVVDVAAHAEFLVDDSAKLDIVEVDSEPWSGRFVPAESKIPTFGFTRAAVWMRCVVRSESDREKTLLFEIGTARLSHVTWYLVADGRVEQTLRAGAADPPADPDWLNRFPIFETTIPPGSERIVYARVEAEKKLEKSLVAEQRLRREADLLREFAEQASKEKSLFLANMSHEVRTPLSALVSLSQAMWMESEKHALPAEFEEYLNRVRSGGKYLNLVLTNLLDVSAAESGRVPVHGKTFYIADWAGDVRNILEPIAESHGAKLHWTLPEDDNESFESDPMRLTQILLNLAHNAIKFGGDGTAEVHIRIEVRDGALVLGVRDNGPGIQAPRLEELFQAYEQGKTQPASYERGVGLGLAVVKLNLGLLGGTIEARNVEPHGMDFEVRVPRWRAKEA
jgi:signal transduction histidine kinase